MRVLLTVHEFFPEFRAGTEVLTLGVARGLRARGHEVRILTGYPERAPLPDASRFDEYEFEGLPVTRFRYGRMPMGQQRSAMELEFDNRLVGDHVRQLVAEWRPDVVHVFHLQRLSASPIDVALEAGVPAVYTPTDFWFVCPTVRLEYPAGFECRGPADDALNCLRHLISVNRPGPIDAAVSLVPDAVLRPLAAAVAATRRSGDVAALRRREHHIASRLERLDYVMAPTKLMRRLLLQSGVPKDRVRLYPYGVESAIVGPIPPRSGRSLRLAFIGTLVESKGPQVAIEAVRLLEHEAVTLDIYGRTDEFPANQARLDALASGDARIRFRGTFPNEEMADVLAGVDALVVPSTWRENAPLVLYSAQAAGRPILGSDVDGITEVVEHGRNGLVFPAGDAAALAAAIRRLLTEPDLLSTLAAAAVRPRTIDDYVSDVESVYATVLDRRRSAA